MLDLCIIDITFQTQTCMSLSTFMSSSDGYNDIVLGFLMSSDYLNDTNNTILHGHFKTSGTQQAYWTTATAVIDMLYSLHVKLRLLTIV